MPWKPEKLPEGFTFVTHFTSGKEGVGKFDGVTLRTPSGDIDIFVSDNVPTIRSFRMQSEIRVGGPDNTVLFRCSPPENPPTPAPVIEPPEPGNS